MTTLQNLELVSILPSTLLLIGLVFMVVVDSYLRRTTRRTLIFVAVLIFLLVLQNFQEYWLARGEARILARTINSIVGYIIRPMILALLFSVVDPDRDYSRFWIPVVLNSLLYLSAFVSPMTFWIDESNHFHSGPLRHVCLILSTLYLSYLFYLTVRGFSRSPKKERWISLFSAILIPAGIIIDYCIGETEQPVTYLTLFIIISAVFYYIWLHFQFVREHEEDLAASQRIHLMVSQIQPHFLINTLTTIQYLCRMDPEKAEYMTGRLTVYLRNNLDSLLRTELIPLEKELEHTRAYAEIEMIRFPQVHIEYDIGDSDFRLPALTIQPMVENAIRHGVRIRKDGRVTVTAKTEDGYHKVIIQDNGKGFTEGSVPRDDRPHIGIRNVRERIQRMCGGSLVIHSVPDEGTTVMILIPVKPGEAVR